MDPLASIKEFRQQAAGSGRTLKVAPPPALPIPPSPTTPPAVGVSDDGDPTGELDLTDLQVMDAAAEPDTAASEVDESNIGMARGRKRLIHVYLPGETRDRLESGRERHGTLGAAVMNALRGSYEWVVANHTPEPVEAVGPFPAPRPAKRRLAVPDARLKPFYVDPAEAKAIDALADQLELSVSELVTIAIDHHYGAGASPAVSRSRAKTKA